MTIKLYDYESTRAEQKLADGGYAVPAWPVTPPTPFASSEDEREFVEPGYRGGDLRYEMPPRDPRPSAQKCRDGNSRGTPEGFDSQSPTPFWLK